MIKVSKIEETMGTQIFKNFLYSKFDFEFLVNENAYFDGWRSKNMGNWIKYISDDGIILEVYTQTYKIRKPKEVTTFELPIPKNINEFIDDMYRFDIIIYWKTIIDELFEPQNYLNVNEIRDYYVKLLAKMNKSFELL